MHFDDILVFLQIVSNGSLTQASKSTRKPKASISHQLKRLETHLGAPLFDRSANKLVLNSTGRGFLEHAKNIKRACERGVDSAKKSQEEMAGKIKVAASGELLSNLLGPLIFHFSNKYPNIDLEVMVMGTNRLVNLRDSIDCILFLGTPPVPEFSDMTARLLGKFPFALYASEHYLDKYGYPPTPSTLFDHNLIGFQSGSSPMIWKIFKEQEEFSIQPNSTLLTNDYTLVKHSAIHGQGICYLPTFFTAQEEEKGLLVRVLPKWQSYDSPMYALFSSHRIRNTHLRALIDMMMKHFDEIFHHSQVGKPKIENLISK